LPVLRRSAARRRADARPRDAALARRPLHVGKPGGRVPRLQSPQGRPTPARSRHEAAARTALVQLAHFAPPHAHDGAFGCEVAQVPLLLMNGRKKFFVALVFGVGAGLLPLAPLPTQGPLEFFNRVAAWISLPGG